LPTLVIIKGADGLFPNEFYDQVDIRKDEAKKYRQTLQERGLVEKKGRTRGAKYYDNGLKSLNVAGNVDLSLSGVSPYKDDISEFPPKGARDGPVIPRRDPSKLWSENRYPDWMRNTLRRACNRKFNEQLKLA